MKIVFDTKVWATEHCHLSPVQMQTPDGAAQLVLSRNDMTIQGWTQVGAATVTAELFDTSSMVDNKVAALRKQATKIRADATAQCTRIEGQINQLLAIENSVGAA